jgi:GABA(A) receptor-associated protein
MTQRPLLSNKLSSFKNTYHFAMRLSESTRVLQKHPDRIPIICEKHVNCDIEELNKQKYLVSDDLTCGQFIYIIRKRLNLPPEKAIFLIINGTIPPISSTISEVYDKNKNEDGFLYITYMSENVFGLGC